MSVDAAGFSCVGSPFASPSVQGARSRNDKHSSLLMQELVELLTEEPPASEPMQDANQKTVDKVTQWLGLALHDKDSVLNHSFQKQAASFYKEDQRERESDVSSVTEACAPPSTWGSETEADIFCIELDLSEPVPSSNLHASSFEDRHHRLNELTFQPRYPSPAKQAQLPRLRVPQHRITL